MIDLKASSFFNSLPKFVQESIMQSGTKFENEDELKAFASNLEQTAQWQ